jgi:uncharacterized protein (TIGR03435 family)
MHKSVIYSGLVAMLFLSIIEAMGISSRVTNDRRIAFEVASVKELPPGMIQPQTMHIDGGRVDCLMQLSRLVATAYNLKAFQISGPNWLDAQKYVIHAKIPDGATRDQVPEMLKSLLADRFKLVAHWERREQPVYALVVAKGGPKLQKAIEADNPPASHGLNAGGNSAEDSSDSYNTTDGKKITIKTEGHGQRTTVTSVTTGGRAGTVRSTTANGTVRLELPKVTLDVFAEEMLANMVGDRPVINKTNLNGYYHIIIEIPFVEYAQYITRPLRRDPDASLVLGPFAGRAASAPAAGTGMTAAEPSGDGALFRAVRKLGLILQSKKAPVKQLIIDRIDKSPTEN